MPKCFPLLFLSFFLCISSARTMAGSDSLLVPLSNAGFEQSDDNTFPKGWTHEGATHEAGSWARLDVAERKSGKQSLEICNLKPASATVRSTQLHLEIGKLYRLSGWIRTDSAYADPLGRYPTPVAATMSMASFPFTNSSPALGGTSDWRKIDVLFFATRGEDQVRLHLGYNGTATGKAWFDDISVEQVNDIAQYIPPETVRWYGPAFRYTDRGWTLVHIEGEPYARGVQYGNLLSKEICAYIEKLGISASSESQKAGWANMRNLTDALFLRKYDEEYLLEMQGICDGALKAGAAVLGRPLDFLDIVTMNSSVDLGQLGGALAKTATPLTGRTFHVDEDEASMPERLHKCSSFLANGSATTDGGIVFGQLFMWNGYQGVHWNVICDVVPAKGHRLVYETFPGGIHSGADFYVNDAGIMIGETTVMQTPFDAEGTPQSSRIRKAAQYAGTIDDVVSILTEKNNGLYTNDWLIGDARTNETAILLLGTKKWHLWRSGKHDFPGGTTDFYWSVNNAKDMDVRKEYAPDPSNAPFDLAFNTWNRDIAFVNFYKEHKGKIDATAAVNLLATSPINRPHACDGKVTTSEMAKHLMLFAHFGKVTLREKFPEKNSRLVADLPNAIPHLSLGYTTFSPVFVAEKLKEQRRAQTLRQVRRTDDMAGTGEAYTFDKSTLWHNTVYPATDADNWFVSGSAAYWNMLNGLPSEGRAALSSLSDQLSDMNTRLLYTVSREGRLAAINAKRDYTEYKDYVIPRIRGTFLLHQMRLILGNQAFSRFMNAVHDRFKNSPMSTAQFASLAEKEGVRKSIIAQWLERDDLPEVSFTGNVERRAEGWNVRLAIHQPADHGYTFATMVAIETARNTIWHVVRVDSATQTLNLAVKEEPVRVIFNAGNDIPATQKNYYTFANFFDDFQNTLIVYGTASQIEANHTLALRYQTVLADRFTESLPPVWRDCEITSDQMATHDFIVLGGAAGNSLVRRLADTLGLAVGRNTFVWRGKTYSDPDDGVILVYPNPFNSSKVVYLVVTNSALQLYQMTKAYQPVPSWAIFKGDQIVEKGYHAVEGFEVDLRQGGDLRSNK
jgi:hypothetical protein